MQDQPNVISYSTPQRQTDAPSPGLAMVFCLPGLICWFVLLGLWFTPRWLRPSFSFLRVFPGGSVMWCWAIAILCALTSLALYLRRRKPWYVWINLVVNIGGLVFTGGVVVLLIAIAVAGPVWSD